MEIHLKKNQAAEIMTPAVDSATPETLKTGLTITDTAYYKDGAGAWTALAITDTFTEIGTTGMYTIELTAAELNHDLIMIKLTATGMADSAVVVRTFAVDIDDVVRSTTPANTLNVDANNRAETLLGAVTHTGATIPTVSTLSGHTPQTADHTSAIAAIPTNPLLATSAPTNFGDLAITATTGRVTVGTNSDKTGYSLTQAFPINFADLAITATTGQVTVGTNSDKTGYSLTQAFPTNFANLSITAGGIVSSAESDKTGFALSAAGVDAILDDAVDTSLIGLPTTLRQLPYFCVQMFRNKLNYIKSSDTMELFEDDNITKKWSHTMVDDATNATRGKGA